MRTILDAGPRYALAILASRSIPAWLLRTRKFIVFQFEQTTTVMAEIRLSKNTAIGESTGPIDRNLEIRWTTEPEEIDAARKLIGANTLIDVTNRSAATAWIDGRLVSAVWCAANFFDEKGTVILEQPSLLDVTCE